MSKHAGGKAVKKTLKVKGGTASRHDAQPGSEPPSAQARGLSPPVHPEGHPPEVWEATNERTKTLLVSPLDVCACFFGFFFGVAAPRRPAAKGNESLSVAQSRVALLRRALHPPSFSPPEKVAHRGKDYTQRASSSARYRACRDDASTRRRSRRRRSPRKSKGGETATKRTRRLLPLPFLFIQEKRFSFFLFLANSFIN